jgi:hypothetical protein
MQSMEENSLPEVAHVVQSSHFPLGILRTQRTQRAKQTTVWMIWGIFVVEVWISSFVLTLASKLTHSA